VHSLNYCLKYGVHYTAFVQQLDDEGIVFLPYVANTGIRNQLRNDIRSIHCREWNEKNYHEILPSVVAEVWHSYLEKVIKVVTSKEKIEKQNIEKKYEKLKIENNSSPFTKSMEKDFKYIYKTLNKNISFTVNVLGDTYSAVMPRRETAEKHEFSVPLLQLLHSFVRNGGKIFNSHYSYGDPLEKIIKENVPKSIDKGNGIEINPIKFNYRSDLCLFGLVSISDENPIASKMYKFMYWLGYNNLVSDEMQLENLGESNNT